MNYKVVINVQTTYADYIPRSLEIDLSFYVKTLNRQILSALIDYAFKHYYTVCHLKVILNFSTILDFLQVLSYV